MKDLKEYNELKPHLSDNRYNIHHSVEQSFYCYTQIMIYEKQFSLCLLQIQFTKMNGYENK